MTEKIETVARNMRLTDNVREYVEKKAIKIIIKFHFLSSLKTSGAGAPLVC